MVRFRAAAADCESVDDPAYLEEFINPTLLPVLHDLAAELERNGTVRATNGLSQALASPTIHFGGGPEKFSLAQQAEFNPIRWLGMGFFSVAE